jgi:hypothetical protein
VESRHHRRAYGKIDAGVSNRKGWRVKHENDKTFSAIRCRRHAACADANDGDSGRYDNGGRYGGRAAAALENNVGAHVKLTKDISFTAATAADREIGVYLGEGLIYHRPERPCAEIQLSDRRRISKIGSPVASGEAKLLVINGPGEMTGGKHTAWSKPISLARSS